MYSLCFLTLRCSSGNDNKIQEEENFIGTWVLIEQKVFGGTPDPEWKSVAISYQINLNANGQFTSDRFAECAEGEYIVSNSDNTLTLKFGCPDFSVIGLSSDGIFKENYVFNDGYLILSSTYLNCDEGCSFKFEKID